MSYWCEEQLVVRISGPEGERQLVLEKPYALVGRHARAEVALDHEAVRKRACLLLAIEGGIYCADLDVDSLDIEQPGRWLQQNEAIRIGPYTLTVELASGAVLDEPDWNPQTARGPSPIPVAHIYCGPLLKDRRRLRYPLMLVGRRPQCSLRLSGIQVSNYHCLLYWSDRRLWCLDLGSSNGTRLGESALGCSEVKLGERFEVGEFSLVYYRWSPRTMTPGFAPQASSASDELEVAFDASVQALDDHDDDEGSVLGMSAEALRRDVEAQQLQQALQQQLQAQAAEFATAREAWEASREQWTAERESLLQQAAQQSDELAQVRLQLAALEQANVDSARLLAAPAQEIVEQPDASRTEVAPIESTTAGEVPNENQTNEFPATAADPLPVELTPVELTPETERFRFKLSVDEPAPAPVLTEVPVLTEPPTIEVHAAATRPAGRRSTTENSELTSFVSGRLGDLEDTRRRRSLVVWTAVTVTVVATAAAGFGIWFWLR